MKDYNTHKFLRLLDKDDINYHYEGKWLVIGRIDSKLENIYLANLRSELTFIPNYIKFNNNGSVDFSDNNLKSFPNDIKFNNEGYVSLSNNKLTSLHDNVEFNNNGSVNLSNNKLTSLSDNIQFNNNGPMDIIFLLNNPLESIPDNIENFYDKLSVRSQKDIKNIDPNHWFFEKERFGL